MVCGMAILKIARMGDPILRRPAEAVSDPTAPEIARLVADMVDTLADAEGAGLAAPQVHVGKRVVIFHIPKRRADDGDAPDGSPAGAVPLTVLINPEIEPLGDEKTSGWEACLSVPDLMGMVPRYRSIRYRGRTLDGGVIERTATGFHARVVQHECDHLDGVLYPQLITDLALFGFAREITRSLPAVAAAAAR